MESVENSESFEQDGRLRDLLAKALVEKITTKAIRVRGHHNNPNRYNKRLFLLNERICKLLTANRISMSFPGGYYWQFCFKEQETFEFLILQIKTGGKAFFLILPSSIAKQFESHIYVPENFMRSRSGRGRHPKVNWIEYLEAWHLLRKPVEAVPAAEAAPPSPSA